jgi:hypothetical protein
MAAKKGKSERPGWLKWFWGFCIGSQRNPTTFQVLEVLVVSEVNEKAAMKEVASAMKEWNKFLKDNGHRP